ncbi:hypothetical protein K435DRAFT_867776 [Dendrothele bispora CBS 962.96]|uniref:Uncharacterized protein n=1 Tax=Dendrothele bispora (strain CBS 962.96) TaxID=1314807 RepID=A0A4S8LDV4_DENBC|nr:hypothetical protein K435DRAFT_867776 [Dendrothele bispora CBS 962.96]
MSRLRPAFRKQRCVVPSASNPFFFNPTPKTVKPNELRKLSANAAAEKRLQQQQASSTTSTASFIADHTFTDEFGDGWTDVDDGDDTGAQGAADKMLAGQVQPDFSHAGGEFFQLVQTF